MPIIRSISGLRATIGDCLSPNLISEYASAFSKILPEGSIVLGRDGRPSGTWIESIVAGTLVACGREIRVLGIVPTPTVQIAVEHSDAVGGIAITASHNPSEWNGLKFIDSNGVFLDANVNAQLWSALDSGIILFDKNPIPKQIIRVENSIESHIESILGLPFLKKDQIIDKIKNMKLKVVVDAVNCSGSLAIPSLLEKLGCEVIRLFCDNSGNFPHIPEPIPENLSQLSEAVMESGADLGIAVDPDADRLVLIDKKGNPIGEEKTIAIAVDAAFTFREFFSTDYNNIAVVNHSTTRLVEDIAAYHKASVSRCAVGEINVVNRMKETKALIGGEGSGGVILPACHYGRDSLVGTALLLALMAEKNQSLSDIVASYPVYAMIKYKQGFNGELTSLINKIVRVFPYGKPIIEDGIKIEFERSWVQIRTSNTEPIIRIIAEATDDDYANKLIESIIALI